MNNEIKRITKKEFIKTIKYNKTKLALSKFLYGVNGMSEESIAIRVVECLEKESNKTILKNIEIREVVENYSNHFVFSNGSGLWFNEIKNCYLYKNFLININKNETSTLVMVYQYLD